LPAAARWRNSIAYCGRRLFNPHAEDVEKLVRIEITLPPKVPWHQRESIMRSGFRVVPIGSAWRVRVGNTVLDARGITVRIEPDYRGPGLVSKTSGIADHCEERGKQ
jgi:hypothetical protein